MAVLRICVLAAIVCMHWAIRLCGLAVGVSILGSNGGLRPAGCCYPSWLGYSGSHSHPLLMQRASLERGRSGSWRCRLPDFACNVACQHPSTDIEGREGWCGTEPQGVASHGDDPCRSHVACFEAIPADDRLGPITRSCPSHGSPSSSTSCWGLTHEESESVRIKWTTPSDLMTRTELDQAHLWHIYDGRRTERRCRTHLSCIARSNRPPRREPLCRFQHPHTFWTHDAEAAQDEVVVAATGWNVQGPGHTGAAIDRGLESMLEGVQSHSLHAEVSPGGGRWRPYEGGDFGMEEYYDRISRISKLNQNFPETWHPRAPQQQQVWHCR